MEDNQIKAFEGLKDVGQAEAIISRVRVEFPDDDDKVAETLDDLLAALDESKPLIGDADDFHNFAVSISKTLNDNAKACFIVQQGLEIHPYNSDLLADALRYGYSSGEKEKCVGWYNTLQSIDKSRWTWRAFSFSIDYLLNQWISSNENDYSIDDILNLVKQYQETIPYKEDAWLCEFDVYEGTNQREKGVAVLKEAIQRFEYCPRCCLRYADILIDNGNFEKAEPIIEKMRKNPKTSEAINISYMYFLDAQCKYARLNKTDDEEEQNRLIWSIYRLFRKAISSHGLRAANSSQIDEYIEELEIDYDIFYPAEWR